MAAAEAKRPQVSLLKVLPKWISLARVWFVGRSRAPLLATESSLAGSCSRCAEEYQQRKHQLCRRVSSHRTGSERWKARGYAAIVVSLACLTTYFYVYISYAQKAFSTALSGG